MISTHRISALIVRVSGASTPDEARQAIREHQKREPKMVTAMDHGVYHVELGTPTVSPAPIYAEARARGMRLDHDDVQWDSDEQAWTIDGMEPSEWLDAMAPSDKVTYMVATRVMDHTRKVAQVRIENARYVIADNVVDAIKAVAQYEDHVEGSDVVIQREGALTFAGYPGTETHRFLACTSEVNRRLKIAEITGALLTA
jgi:hypothetical protein